MELVLMRYTPKQRDPLSVRDHTSEVQLLDIVNDGRAKDLIARKYAEYQSADQVEFFVVHASEMLVERPKVTRR